MFNTCSYRACHHLMTIFVATVLIKKMQTAICNGNNDVCTAVQMQHTFRDRNLNCFAIRASKQASQQQLKRWRLNKSQQASSSNVRVINEHLYIIERERETAKQTEYSSWRCSLCKFDVNLFLWFFNFSHFIHPQSI